MQDTGSRFLGAGSCMCKVDAAATTKLVQYLTKLSRSLTKFGEVAAKFDEVAAALTKLLTKVNKVEKESL